MLDNNLYNNMYNHMVSVHITSWHLFPHLFIQSESDIKSTSSSDDDSDESVAGVTCLTFFYTSGGFWQVIMKLYCFDFIIFLSSFAQSIVVNVNMQLDNSEFCNPIGDEHTPVVVIKSFCF